MIEEDRTVSFELAGDPEIDYLVEFIETAKRGIHKSRPRGGRAGGDAE